ncbi:MAG: cytochrome c [Lentilitoribacter sp.]
MLRRLFLTTITSLTIGMVSGSVSTAQDANSKADISHGRDLARANCATCHAVTIDGASPLHQAVPFWRMTIHRDVTTIERDLLNHALPQNNVMPVFNLTPKQARDIAAWIAWVQPRAHGKRILEANCAKCHAISAQGDSPHPDAPLFRELMQFYPVDAIEEAFSQGIETSHPDMPIFKMTELQVADVIVYLQSIQNEK